MLRVPLDSRIAGVLPYNADMKRPAKRVATPAAAPKPKPEPRPEPSAIKLVVYPHPKLKIVAKDVTQFDAWLLGVAERMKDLMVEHKGVGLAAPQVGLSIRLFVASPTG